MLTLEDLGNLGEFVGAVAVVVTLLYLVLQVRQNTTQLLQNTRSVHLAALEANLHAGNRVRELLIMDEGLSDLHIKGLQGYSQLDRAERLRFGMLLQNFFSTVQAAVVRRRLLDASSSRMRRDKDELVGYMPFGDAMSHLDSLLVHAGVREWWDRHQGIYRQEFVEVVKERLAHIGHGAHNTEDGGTGFR